MGGNVGDTIAIFSSARAWIEQSIGEISIASGIYRTEAWGVTGQDNYYNQVLVISTSLSVERLLVEIMKIEQRMGRERAERNAPRTLDLDILFYDDLVVQTENLTIPHPRLHLRNFCLVPLNEVVPAYIHPLLRKTVRQLKIECRDKLTVELVIPSSHNHSNAL
jgi:2-amino-4-hydroxy-6-hydroxymethyldihydropteridine diphosphokinase